ncbi:MAG: hypothetical protein AAFQ65_09530 [Myxococcota bacterium]
MSEPAPELDPAAVERKLKLAAGLFDMALQVKRDQLRRKHPDLSERELNHRAYALIEKGCR